MKTRILIFIAFVVGIVFLSYVYASAYVECPEGLQWDLSCSFPSMTSSYMEKIIPTLDDFKNTLSEPYDIDTIFSKFGPPHNDIGSGIHIYVYKLNDLTEIWIGYTDHIWYIKHVNSDGTLLEELFMENEN